MPANACLKVHKASGWNHCNWQPSYFLLLHQMPSKTTKTTRRTTGTMQYSRRRNSECCDGSIWITRCLNLSSDPERTGLIMRSSVITYGASRRSRCVGNYLFKCRCYNRCSALDSDATRVNAEFEFSVAHFGASQTCNRKTNIKYGMS